MVTFLTLKFVRDTIFSTCDAISIATAVTSDRKILILLAVITLLSSNKLLLRFLLILVPYRTWFPSFRSGYSVMF